MFPRTEDVPGLVVFVLPGFVTLALLASLRGPRKRSQIEWVAWSLLGSVIAYASTSAVLAHFRELPTHPEQDPQFIVVLFSTAVLMGFVFDFATRIPRLGPWLSGLGAMTEPKVWNGLLRPGQWVQVRLKNGETLYGEISQCTNDPNEEHVELFIESVETLDPDTGAWLRLDGTHGVYVPGDQLTWVQILSPAAGVTKWPAPN